MRNQNRNQVRNNNTRKSNNKRGRKPYVYRGPVLKQHMNHNILPEGQKFFVRALAHCHHQIEEILELISRTPPKFQKALRIKKAKLQREAEYITNVKLKGVNIYG